MRLRINFEDCCNEWDLYIEVDDDACPYNEVSKFVRDYLNKLDNPTAVFRWYDVVNNEGGVNPAERIYTAATTVWITINFDGSIISVYHTKNAAIWDRMAYVKQGKGRDYDIDTLVASARALVVERAMPSEYDI